jgi:hypothetical protein
MQFAQISAQLKKYKNVHVKENWIKQCHQFLINKDPQLGGGVLIEKYVFLP